MRKCPIILCLTVMSTQVWALDQGDPVFEKYVSETEFPGLIKEMKLTAEDGEYKIFTSNSDWMFVDGIARYVCKSNSVTLPKGVSVEDCVTAFRKQNLSLAVSVTPDAVVSLEKFRRTAAEGKIIVPIMVEGQSISEAVVKVDEERKSLSATAPTQKIEPVVQKYDDSGIQKEIGSLKGLLTGVQTSITEFLKVQDEKEIVTQQEVAELRGEVAGLATAEEVKKFNERLATVENESAPLAEQSVMDEWGLWIIGGVAFFLAVVGWRVRQNRLASIQSLESVLKRPIGLSTEDVQVLVDSALAPVVTELGAVKNQTNNIKGDVDLNKKEIAGMKEDVKVLLEITMEDVILEDSLVEKCKALPVGESYTVHTGVSGEVFANKFVRATTGVRMFDIGHQSPSHVVAFENIEKTMRRAAFQRRLLSRIRQSSAA